jgi:hypothetical protein
MFETYLHIKNRLFEKYILVKIFLMKLNWWFGFYKIESLLKINGEQL